MSKSKLWGGRFSKRTNELVNEFTKSIHYDQKLAECDCWNSIVHIDVLKKAKLLTAVEHKKLKKGLNKILSKIQNGRFEIDPSFEDIHSYIQYLLEKDTAVGKAALKLQTCRSRNDQIVFDTTLFCLVNIDTTKILIERLKASLTNLAKKNAHLYIPGYTHLQHAIPLALKNYLSAHGHMLEKDIARLLDAKRNINFTMGSGALAGTFIPASHYTDIPAPQSALATVSDRDFVIEILSALAITGMHLSRLAEDMILWASKEFDFIDIDDAFCTGSSLMPQKKNPDVLELVRGYSGRLTGNLVSVLVTMKGLPLSYNRDMQLDKEPLFDSFKIVQDESRVLAELFKNVQFKKENIAKQLEDECLYATDMADYLVQNGVPFKDAHTAIGKLIQLKLKKNKNIADMTDIELKNIHPLLKAKVLKKLMNPKTSVQSKKSLRQVRQK